MWLIKMLEVRVVGRGAGITILLHGGFWGQGAKNRGMPSVCVRGGNRKIIMLLILLLQLLGRKGERLRGLDYEMLAGEKRLVFTKLPLKSFLLLV